MQGIRNKKVWFFFVLGIMALATYFLWQAGNGEKKAYANGRIVQREGGNVVWLSFDGGRTAHGAARETA